ncbi:MAG: tyrosine-type recombinase/integrase [Nanoarchaeota archaeon]
MDIPYLIKKEALRRGLSHRTITAYCYCVQRFLQRCHKEPRSITKKDIRDYLDTLIEKGASGNTLNVYLSALKFFFEEILCKRLLIYMKYSKTPQTLPTFLTQEEIKRLFAAITNVKHSLMIRLMYASGLRVSELAHLKVTDLELDLLYGWVRRGKGNKDRRFIVAELLRDEIQAYLVQHGLSSHQWLFPGRNGKSVSVQTLHVIVKHAAKKASIQKNVHCHTLRHSYATHLIENGYSIGHVQILLGHASAETTNRYVHMANPESFSVKSPYDNLASP